MEFPVVTSKITEKQFNSFIKWFEASAEVILFDENIARRIRLSNMLHRVLSLQRLQQSVEHEEEIFESNTKKMKLEPAVTLPNELWMKILNYMKTKDVFSNLTLVNKHFNHIVRDPSTLKYLHLKDINDMDSFKSISKVIKRSKNLLEVKIMYSEIEDRYSIDTLDRDFKLKWKMERDNKRFFKSLMQLALKIPKLTSLKMETVGKDAKTLMSEICGKYLIDHGQNLEHLEIKNVYFENIDKKQLSKFTKLKSLLMRHVHVQHNSCYSALRAIANSCINLERIHFSKLNVDEHDSLAGGLHYLFEERRNTLRYLTIEDHYNLRNDEFLKNLVFCNNMEQIKIMDASFIGNKALDIILNLPNLKVLELHKLGNLKDKSPHYREEPEKDPIDVNSFFRLLNTNKLRVLSIIDSPIITAETIKRLSSNNGCPKLEKLIFEKCPNLKIKDDILKNFVANFPCLITLQLHWQMILGISYQLWDELSQKIRISITIGKSILSCEDFVINEKFIIGTT